MMYPKLGLFAIGAWFGYLVSLVLFSAFLYKIKSNPIDVNY